MTIYYSNSSQGFYDTDIVEYLNLPDDILEITSEMRDNFIYELNSNNKMILVQNGTIQLTEKIFTWDEIRAARNMLLINSDHTQLPDFPEAKKQEWAGYRQALREIPQTYSNTQDIIWPTAPV
jgi:hypothetical protein